MTIPTGHIIAEGGRGRRVWRLWSDGTVQRTSSRLKYQEPYTDETVPETIRKTALQYGVPLRGFRERDPLKRRTS
jgi:hypothetical protein